MHASGPGTEYPYFIKAQALEMRKQSYCSQSQEEEVRYLT